MKGKVLTLDELMHLLICLEKDALAALEKVESSVDLVNWRRIYITGGHNGTQT